MKNVFVISLLCVLFVHCTNDRPLPNGFETLQRSDKGSVKVKNLYAKRSARYWMTPAAGKMSTLLLGSYKNLRSHILFKFYKFTGIDTGSVVSATLKLSMAHVYGSGTTIQADVYPVTTTWSDVSVRWKDIENNIDRSQSMGSVTIACPDSVPDSSLAVNIPMSPELIHRWLKSSDDNNGFVIVAGQSDFMAEFYSTDAVTYWATISIEHMNTDGTKDTTIVNNYIHDASLIVNTTAEPEEQLIRDQESLAVGDVSGDRSLLYFDFSEIPKNITLHQAYLTLFVQQEKSETRSFGMPMQTAMVTSDSSWNIADFSIDSTRTNPSAVALASKDSVVLSTSSDIYYLTSIVQNWLFDSTKNKGLLLRPINTGAFISNISFYPVRADSLYTPILRLTYSEPPAGRFEIP
jgi:hypothetical protein